MQSRILAIIALFSLLVGAITFVVLYQVRPRGMMGHGNGQSDLWIPIVVVPLTFVMIALSYYLIFPEISQKRQEPMKSVEKASQSQTVIEEQVSSLNTVLKVLREDERKVVETIMKAGGNMLQKDIARVTGFSRVKTHRVLYRLSKRGVVTAEKYYNTYQISLADWLRQKGE
jgi:uncharacterized membrane protein